MTYSITIQDRQPKTYQRLDAATTYADNQATELGLEIEVTHTETEAVVYVTSPRAIAKRDAGVHFVPWTRLETPKFTAPHFDTHYPAYTRIRIPAVVYRVHDLELAKAEDRKPWIVWDGRSGKTQDCANTTESRKLLTAMKNGKVL